MPLTDKIEYSQKKLIMLSSKMKLWKYTDRLPMYFEKLASMFPDFMTYSMPLAETMIKNHQNRIKQLEKNGWYEQLKKTT